MVSGSKKLSFAIGTILNPVFYSLYVVGKKMKWDEAYYSPTLRVHYGLILEEFFPSSNKRRPALHPQAYISNSDMDVKETAHTEWGQERETGFLTQ